MTQEDKELLLKDLCARLPYGIVCRVKIESDFEIPYETDVILSQHNISYVFDLGYEWLWCKPYLRPMSSMTDEERELMKGSVICFNEFEGCSTLFDVEGINWLNAHHFDYRGLIEKGLAIDCTGLNIY